MDHDTQSEAGESAGEQDDDDIQSPICEERFRDISISSPSDKSFSSLRANWVCSVSTVELLKNAKSGACSDIGLSSSVALRISNHALCEPLVSSLRTWWRTCRSGPRNAKKGF